MPRWSDVVNNPLEVDLLPAIYAAISIPTREIRAQLTEEGLSFADPDLPPIPPLAALDHAAARVLRGSQARGVAISAVGGLVGAVAIPPEVLASLVHLLRLAQRLAVVYGVDPEHDHGKLTLWRAVAAAYDLELPQEGPVGLKLGDLSRLLQDALPATRDASLWMARELAARTALSIAARVWRVIPGVGAGVAAWSAHRRIERLGVKMQAVFRAHAESLDWDLRDEVVGVELRR